MGDMAEKLKTVVERGKNPPPVEKYTGDVSDMISTGSTLLDLAISGGRVRGGGMPGGILVEIAGPSSSGKTVLLSEMAYQVQKKGGQVMFRDPEARLNEDYVKLFGVDLSTIDYARPKTVPQLFNDIRKWKPSPKGKIHGVFADSLAALSTDMELEKDGGDKMGTRRAKEFSEELRKTAITIKDENYLVVCSNQLRDNVDGGPWAPAYITPGGQAIPFYSSLRLRVKSFSKQKKTMTVEGVEVSHTPSIVSKIEVAKSSVWKPYGEASVTIIFDYGIDDIGDNLKFLHRFTKSDEIMLGETVLAKRMDKAISVVEEEGLEDKLRDAVIDLWEKIEGKKSSKRKPKGR